jgi:8-oxo-dGTP pyrophosphatase MutT (NUDIX family)
MHREMLLKGLTAHQPYDETEREMLARMRNFVQRNPDCFSPSLASGHITGGAWILDRTRRYALLTHHRKLDKWLQLGGHADGETDALAIALREAREESGLTTIRPVSHTIFDVDVHPIPARGVQPAHCHYDIRFLMEADRSEALQVSSESKALAWVEIAAISRYSTEASMVRLAAKTGLYFRAGTAARQCS